MKKILIIGEFPAPYRVDVFRDLSKEYETTVFFEAQQDSNRTTEWLNTNGLSCDILDNIKSIKKFKKVLKNIKDFDCVILYNNSLKYSIITELVCIYNKVRFFIHCDGSFDIVEKNLLKKLVKSYLTKKAFACFAGSISAKEYFLYYGAEQARIYSHQFTSLHEEDIEKNLITIEKRINLKKELNIIENKMIISVGRYIDVKGFDVLIEASRKLTKDTGIYIIGGEPSKEFVELKQKYNLGNLHFLNFMDREKLRKHYLAADIFVLMTRGDTWGLVINEAMAMGLPIITTEKCVAGTELIDNGINGYVIPVDNVEKLNKKIQTLLTDDEKRVRISKNNLKKMEENLIENISKNHIEVINKLII